MSSEHVVGRRRLFVLGAAAAVIPACGGDGSPLGGLRSGADGRIDGGQLEWWHLERQREQRWLRQQWREQQQRRIDQQRWLHQQRWIDQQRRFHQQRRLDEQRRIDQ